MREWMEEHAPQFVASWPLQVDDRVIGFSEKVKAALPLLNLIFAVQAPIAARAITRWNLQDVLLLGGGTPTPFSPTAQQVLYYTDANPVVIEEADQAGYKTALVDIRNPQDFQQVRGVRSVVATGLFHFLEDDAARGVLGMFRALGYQTFVFNNMRYVGEEEHAPLGILDEWTKMGFRLHPRTVADMEDLVAGIWNLEEVCSIVELYRADPDLGPLFNTDECNQFLTYKVTAA